MEQVSRSLFLKIAAAAVAIGGGGKYFLGRVTDPKKGGILGSQAERAFPSSATWMPIRSAGCASM